MSDEKLELLEKCHDAEVALNNVFMAISEIIEKYYWNYEPSASAALSYGNIVGSEVCKIDKKAKWSWEYIVGYKKIMWLCSVALDYCNSASELLESVRSGGGSDE